MNYSTWYKRISQPFRSYFAKRILQTLDSLLVVAIALAYLIVLLFLVATADARIVKALLVPAFTFCFVTLIRTILNYPRPYECASIDPLISKQTHGKSCPSRHMASAVIISNMFWWLSPLMGVIACGGCLLIAFTRIVGGVHFPRDIVLATVISLICSIVGFIIIP